ncbi:MAG: carbon starvation protein A [Planctomycetota bacterium]
MAVLLLALGVAAAFLLAYHTYGRWLGSRIFQLSASAVCPSYSQQDNQDFVPTPKSVVFGHHFTSIAGTGPIVGPAIAVIWGWLPALLWVVFGSIFMGAVHDFGALVVSLRHKGRTVGDVAGDLLNKRVRLLFLFVLFLALTIVLAIFGLVIAAVFKLYPAAIFPCVVQIPLALAIGLYLHRKGVGLLLPSLVALAVMYGTVFFGNAGPIADFNQWAADLPRITWVILLLAYSAVASVLPVWSLLQPRDYINSLQLLTALALIVLGLIAAALFGGAPPSPGIERQPLELVAPMVRFDAADAPLIFPFLFITIACGAISGFHCLVSSGTSSKQLQHEPQARFVGFGAMLTEGFLATLVILACTAGLGLGTTFSNTWVPGAYDSEPEGSNNHGYSTGFLAPDGSSRLVYIFSPTSKTPDELIYPIGSKTFGEDFDYGTRALQPNDEIVVNRDSGTYGSSVIHPPDAALIGTTAYINRYSAWSSSEGLKEKVSAFIDGGGNFLKAFGMPTTWAIPLLAVLVASFAGTTLDTATRLQRYVVQELLGTFTTKRHTPTAPSEPGRVAPADPPQPLLTNKYLATLLAVTTAFALALLPAPGASFSWSAAGGGGLILWPMFGATNQLLGGLAFLVIAFYLLRRRKPIWFIVPPLLFMLVMPAWALIIQLNQWLASDEPNHVLIAIAIATLILEAWMIAEAFRLYDKHLRQSQTNPAGS